MKHGGNLREVAQRYSIPFHDWIDLSTGINPNGWQPPAIPSHVWQRLPEENDGLIEAAQHYYGVDKLLAVAGSQAAIQSLPYCRQKSRVGIISPAYAEYRYCWQRAGHIVQAISRDDVEQHIDHLDVLIVVNPNNPDTYCHDAETLIRWHHQLLKRGGWLIVDEAFMDATPAYSLFHYDLSNLPNLIVLRSLGKFFGLAGLRLGFVSAQSDILEKIRQQLGTWPISHPSRWLGRKALEDKTWQQKTRLQLIQQSQDLKQVLAPLEENHIYCTALFCYIRLDNAKAVQHYLAQNGIWIRCFDDPDAVRIGLVKNKYQLEQLRKSLMVSD